MFFDWHSYTYLNKLNNLRIPVVLTNKNKKIKEFYLKSDFTLSSSFSLTISILTLIILLFIFMPNEWLNMSNILSILLFVPNSI
jgi:NADH-ubiquinone oxidoreductase chain 2